MHRLDVEDFKYITVFLQSAYVNQMQANATLM
ncbi:hypothetical protein OMCYN_00803 [cyanobiont of Ornithocercus magnificus]|nr:hypothetical protein OMCYN_00803 [cyanobiont of Ornithocercus magnificus]